MIEAIMIICASVIFCTLVICGSWIKVEQIRQVNNGNTICTGTNNKI